MVLITFLIFITCFNASAFDVQISRPIYSPISQNIQGITQSEHFWFISNTKKIFRIPKRKQLIPRNFYPNVIPTYDFLQIPDHLLKLGYNHFGGVSVFQDQIIVALERVKPMKILFFDLYSLDLVREFNVPSQLDSLSWVVGTEDGIYFSENKLGDDFPLFFLKNGAAEALPIKVNFELSRIQGGTYSKKSNSIFISADRGARSGGVFRINLTKMELDHEVGIIYNPGFPAYQELEGLTFHDSRNAEILTLLLLDNNLVEDSFHFVTIKNFY